MVCKSWQHIVSQVPEIKQANNWFKVTSKRVFALQCIQIWLLVRENHKKGSRSMIPREFQFSSLINDGCTVQLPHPDPVAFDRRSAPFDSWTHRPTDALLKCLCKRDGLRQFFSFLYQSKKLTKCRLTFSKCLLRFPIRHIFQVASPSSRCISKHKTKLMKLTFIVLRIY